MRRTPLPLHSHGSRRRPKKRRTLRWILLVLLLLILAWIGWNRIDAAPSPAATRLSQPLPHEIADADNAWLYLYGLGAAENDDPIRQGRVRVDGINAHARRTIMPLTDAAELMRLRGWLGHVGPNPATDSSGESCPFLYVNCLDWAREHKVMLDRLAEVNRVRLSRLSTLMTLPGWDRLTEPAVIEGADVDSFWQYRDLLALRTVTALDNNDDAGLALVVRDIANATAFWNRVAGRPQDFYSTIVIAATRQQMHRLLSNVLDHLDAGRIAALKSDIDEILKSPPAMDWSVAVRQQFQSDAQYSDTFMRTASESLRLCFSGDGEGCNNLVVHLGYARQDTLNRTAENYEASLRELVASPADYARVRAENAAAFAARSPDFEHIGSAVQTLAYNPMGKILAGAHEPDGEPSRRLYELEALRRAIVLKREALLRNVAAAQMPAFLASQPADLHNPLNGQPFGWDARQNEIYFAPVTNFWSIPRFNFSYSARSPAAVQACATPLALELTEFNGETAQPPITVISCGSGGLAFADKTSAAASRYAAVRVVQADGKLDARVHLQSKEKRLVFSEVLGASFDGTQEIWLQVPSRDKSDRIRLRRATDKPLAPMVALSVSRQPARSVLQEIAKQGQSRLDGIELAAETRVSLDADLPLDEAVQRLAEAGGLQAERIAERHFVLKKKAP